MKKVFMFGVVFMTIFSVFSGCSQNNNTGKIIEEDPFYSLQAAYNQGLLKKKDLKSIAKLKINGNSEKLDESIESTIKQAYKKSTIKQAYKNRYPQEGDNEVIISKYLGTYNGNVAIMIDYKNSEYIDVCWEEKIAGVTFTYSNAQRIYIWKE